jgi:hypothetical protein
VLAHIELLFLMLLLLIILSLIPSTLPLNHEGPFSPHSSGMSLIDQAKFNQQNTLYFSATRLQKCAVMAHQGEFMSATLN